MKMANEKRLIDANALIEDLRESHHYVSGLAEVPEEQKHRDILYAQAGTFLEAVLRVKKQPTVFELCMSRFIPENIEVIGNIHDNPELLQEA